MPKYFFTAKSHKGDTHSGTLEAKDKRELARLLRRDGYVLISALVEEDSPKAKFEICLPIFGGVSFGEKMMFVRNLKVMIGAGLSLPKTLEILALQTKSRKFKKVLFEMIDKVMKGESFSSTLSKHPGIFSEFFCSMVKVGEESGTLEGNLGILVRQMEREKELKAKIQGAMIYPVVIIITMIGIGIAMLVLVVPKLAETFEELEIELPLTTRLVIFLGNFLVEKWYFIPFIVIAVFILARISIGTQSGKKMLSSLTLKIPVVSTLIKQTQSAHTVRTLSSLITAGVPLVRSLEIVSETLSNFYYKEALRQAIVRIKKGDRLSAALKPYQDIYPLTVIQMIEVGEETGKTAEILDKLGIFFEEEVANAAKNLVSLVEPVLMLLVGGAVGFFAISMIQPMYSMLQGI